MEREGEIGSAGIFRGVLPCRGLPKTGIFPGMIVLAARCATIGRCKSEAEGGFSRVDDTTAAI